MALKFDLPLRPALYYDYKEMEEISKVPSRVSASDFDECNNFYKDLAEVLSRQLVLVAGLNNLIKRGDYDLFSGSTRISKSNKVIKEFSTLDKFADVDLVRKLDTIEEPFYLVQQETIDSRLRNGIAHYKYEYQESTQVITYYPKKEGTSRKTSQSISFLEFMRKTLLLFREVHSLNHIIKALFYYSILVLKKEV